jgi:hypothetical protein
MVKQEIIKMDDTMHRLLKKQTLYVVLLVFISILSAQVVLADEESVVFGVD